ncbi:hypothetical protein D6C97_10566 [Aureobasidium pullulans]|nr:hypothetical protein D6C97_10566 [Aureobasidium pullulans]
MSTFLLFCLAQIPASHNFFSLVRNSTQSFFDTPCTSPPIPPFISDISTHDQIHDFLTQNAAILPAGIETCQYAILDDRSVSDDTIILAHSYSSLQMRDPDTMTEEEAKQWMRDCEEDEEGEDDGWRAWRVRFEDAEKMATMLCFEGDFTVKLYSEEFVERYTGEDGVFGFQDARRAFVGSKVVRRRL